MASSTSLGSRASLSTIRSYSESVRPSSRWRESAAAPGPGGECLSISVISGIRWSEEAAEYLEAVGRTGQSVHRVLRVRHQPEHVAGLVHDSGDVPRGSVRVLPRRITIGDLAIGLDLVEHLLRCPEPPFPVLDRYRQPSDA